MKRPCAVAIGDAGNLRQAVFELRDCIGDFDERLFSLMNHDDVDFRMMGEQRFGGAGRVVAAGDDEEVGILLLQQLGEVEELLCAGLKTHR